MIQQNRLKATLTPPILLLSYCMFDKNITHVLVSLRIKEMVEFRGEVKYASVEERQRNMFSGKHGSSNAFIP